MTNVKLKYLTVSYVFRLMFCHRHQTDPKNIERRKYS